MSEKDHVDRDDLMERTRAAVAFCNTTNDPGADMVAFMAIFHPEVSEDRVRRMAQAARENKR
ncbi:hypothetical protein KL86PLE_90700 [uncultured Pleomorphomonas sp.]|uniref:Uncharacterized protein n=1 Tax=uncultured Pleomorphomonas sp. TaxID=442121 RepID=A0A212LQN0_9HYPH|nr:hypothetical protein [uncultured Pleomorphomonas sp.]SCM79905.1 hypothetical protein KL86PLE_90700 [uncultured Pleomorphomonas sp.]